MSPHSPKFKRWGSLLAVGIAGAVLSLSPLTYLHLHPNTPPFCGLETLGAFILTSFALVAVAALSILLTAVAGIGMMLSRQAKTPPGK